MLVDETNMVMERINRMHVTEATLLQSAVSSVLSKKGGTHFQDRIKRLSIETQARRFSTTGKIEYEQVIEDGTEDGAERR